MRQPKTTPSLRRAAALMIGALCCAASAADPRLHEIRYAAGSVVDVPVRRGTVTHIELDADEAITAVGTGVGADCAKPESSWCVAAQPGDRHLFVKPRADARGPNNLAVVTDRRAHTFRLVVLQESDKKQPLYRLVVRAAPPKQMQPAPTPPALPSMPPIPLPPPIDEAALVSERLDAAPFVVNTAYAIAEGVSSADIVPTLVFDDGRFTYLRFAGNRELPAVFHVLGDGAETLVNTRMEGELLVVDRVSRRLMLRVGQAVVGLWNEAFDAEGAAPRHGTTVDGVRRVIRHGPGDARQLEDPQ